MLRKRGKYSGRLVFTHTTPARRYPLLDIKNKNKIRVCILYLYSFGECSRFVFGLSGVGRMDGELFHTYASSADEPDEDAPVTVPTGDAFEAPPVPPGDHIAWSEPSLIIAIMR
jgi:hypothetical protein